MATTGVSNVSVTIETVVSAMVTKTLINKSVALAMPGVWDRSSEVHPGMDKLDMINLVELAEQTVNEDGTPMTPQTIVPGSETLGLDQHKGIPWALTKRGALQSKIALVQKTIETGIKTLAKGVDNFIFSQADAAAGTVVTAFAADGLAAIRAVKIAFDLANVDEDGRAIACNPLFIDKLLSEGVIIKANEYGSTEGLRKGKVAELFGIAIFESNSGSIADDGFIGLGMEAMAFARQRQMEFEEQYQVLGQKTDYALVHLFGAESTLGTNPRIYKYAPV